MIDWAFIANLEGTRYSGYVPTPGHSGVTIASGFDIGQVTPEEIKAAFSSDLAKKLLPYAGLHDGVAAAALRMHPLTVTMAEATIINQYARKAAVDALASHFQTVAGVPFSSIPPAAQTVLASVTFQYGSPWARTPHFWFHATSRNWKEVINDLRHFGDDFPTRRNKEADYLEHNLP